MELKITKTKKILPMVFAMIFIQVSFEMELKDLLSMKRRSAVDRKKAQIPQAMLSLYEKQMNHEYDTTALPLPGRLTRSANTVRSYTHQGEFFEFMNTLNYRWWHRTDCRLQSLEIVRRVH